MTTTPITTRLLPGDNPVLLIHGFASSARIDWESTGFTAALTSRGRGAVLVQLPGHDSGPTSSQLDGSLTLAELVDAIAEAGQATDATPPDVVGYSLGARLAWALAVATPVRHLVLGGLSAFDPFGSLDIAALGEVVAGRSEATDPMQGMLAHMVSVAGPDTAATLALLDALGRDPFDPTLGTPTAPTLFLSGDADPMSEGIEAVAASVPGARLERVPGDHQAALASAEFRDLALAFLG